MNKKHLEELLSISKDYNEPIEKLIKTYSQKQSDYLRREGKSYVDWFDRQGKLGERAVRVIRQYYIRKTISKGFFF